MLAQGDSEGRVGTVGGCFYYSHIIADVRYYI